MSVDFQVVWPQEVVKVHQIRLAQLVPGVPRAFDIVGEDFRSVDEVLINDIPSPDVTILSKTRLIAQLPDILQKAFGLTSVTVTSRKLTITERSYLRFRIGSTPGRVQGILRLVQLFVKVLLSTPGRDIFSKKIGGGVMRNLGAYYGADEGGSLVNNVVIAVQTTARQIISIQGRDTGIPLDERLLAARVVSSGFNREEGAILVSVEVTSQAGRAATANLEF
jgi:hypothetical protein